MEWEIGQLPTDPVLYSIDAASINVDQYFYYYWTFLEELPRFQSSNSNSPSDWYWDWRWNDVVLNHDLTAATTTVADDKKNIIQLAGVAGKAASKVDGVDMEELQRYFNKPIVEAAKEIGVGLTLLKKRCRQLGIKRWPHRKIKSINSLIHNLSDLAQPNWDQVRPILEEQRRMVQAQPHLDLTCQVKKIRQKCFKAVYSANNNTTTTRTKAMARKTSLLICT